MSINLNEAVKQYRDKRRGLNLFDCNAWVGEQVLPHFASLPDIPALLRELDRCEIEKAVVTSTTALFSNPITGNERVSEGIRPHRNRLSGAFVLLPTTMNEQGNSAAEVINKAFGNGFRIFRMYPKFMGFTMQDWCVGDLLEIMAHRRLPLMIAHDETSWPEIENIIKKYPNMPVIIDCSFKKVIYYSRILRRRLERNPNLFFETHGLLNQELLENLAVTGLAEKFIFGSFVPFWDPHAALGNLCGANIDIASAELIAGNNLRKLLDNVK